MPKEIARFESLIEAAGGVFTADMALKCIEFARQMMVNGEVSVEHYYACKKILLDRVEAANEFMH